ncbi:MAG TPA: outer membrane lipoprotein-sorting protein [Tepiditoga sp.]|nr:outer membrane lipoprotein-sorting protein [Tepiditoga sp.]
MYKNNKTLSLMRVTEPNDVKNTTVLNISEDEQYVYMPSLRSVKRISGNGKDESFLDTDFKYSDLNIISGDISDNYYLYSEDNENYILKYDFNDDSEYGYSFLKISKSDFLMSEISFFSKNEKPLKKLYIENYIKNGEKYTIKNIKVESQISDHYTELNMENTEYDIPITEKFFNKINISMPVLIYR